MKRLGSFLMAAAVLWAAGVMPAQAQTVTDTIPVGNNPAAMAVNAVTNKIYVANQLDGTVSVIDGATNATTTLVTGSTPFALAVNPVTNKIYVANFGSNNVTVIDGATHSTTTVATGTGPRAVAVNPATNKIYVANLDSNNVTVIDGATNGTITVGAGSAPFALAVNPVTNKIYVANDFSGNVTAIDGATNSTTTVGAGTGPNAVAVNPVTNKIYVANLSSGNVTVIDGATNSTITVGAGTSPNAVAVNPLANKIYVANAGGNVTVIDGATNSTTTVGAGSSPDAVAVNPTTNQIYVANKSSNNVTVIDGATNSTSSVSGGNTPQAVAINPVTDKIYVTATFTGVTVIDGATNLTETLTNPNGPGWAAVNPVTDKIYVTNSVSNNVTVIDGATNSTTTVGAGSYPEDVAVNPLTDKIFVANCGTNCGGQGFGNVTVIDGATNSTVTVTDQNADGPFTLAVNSLTNKIYVTNFYSNNVTVIDGATDSTTTVAVGNNPFDVAVNPATNKIYVVNENFFGQGSSYVTVIDGATNSTTTVGVGTLPGAVAVNPATNKIYVTNGADSTVTVIDGATNSTTTVAVGSGPQWVAVNPVTNKIYVSNINDNTVTVIDGATNSTTTVVAGYGPSPVSVNPSTNKIYVGNYFGSNVTVIDGATNSTTTVGTGNEPQGLAVNPVTNKIYVPNFLGYSVTVIDEQQVQPIQLEADVEFLPGNVTGSFTPIFDFTAEPDPNNLLFQVDTWQGPWTAATNLGGGDFSGQTTALQPGVHIVYAYATDGQDATSTNTGFQSSPLISDITAYLFLVSPPKATLSPSSLAFGNQAINTTSVSQSVTLTNDSGAPLAIASIAASGDYSASWTCGATLAAGASCTIEVAFTPTISGSDPGTLTVTDDNNGVNGSTQIVTLTGAGATPPQVSLSTTSLSFGNEPVSQPSAPQVVTLTNTGTQTLNISTITITGANLSDFAQTNNCGSSVAGGASCIINATFKPTAVGARTASITITDNAGDSPQNVALSGTGVTTVTVTPASLVFGNQAVNTTSAAKTVTVKNTGLGQLTFSSITASGDFSQTNNCTGSFAPGKSCTINVKFTPTALGTRTGALTITDDALTSPQSVSLSGTGIAQVTLNHTSLVFGTFTVGVTSPPKSVTLKNNLNSVLTIISITASGDFAETNTCGGSVPALGSCTINVTFTPTAKGTRTGTLTVTDSANNSPQTVALTGTGK